MCCLVVWLGSGIGLGLDQISVCSLGGYAHVSVVVSVVIVTLPDDPRLRSYDDSGSIHLGTPFSFSRNYPDKLDPRR